MTNLSPNMTVFTLKVDGLNKSVKIKFCRVDYFFR